MTAEIPVFAARASGTRFSTARKTLMARCISCSDEPWIVPSSSTVVNQPSFDRLRRTSGGRPSATSLKNRRTTWGTVSSKQIAVA